MKIGDVVYATQDIWQDADEDRPPFRCAAKGDKLIVRDDVGTMGFVAYVSHENRTDNSFGVTADEIREGAT